MVAACAGHRPREVRRLTVAKEVGHEHPVVVIHPVDQVGPLPLRPEDAVDEERHRAGAAVDVGEFVAVEHHRVRSHVRHGHPRTRVTS